VCVCRAVERHDQPLDAPARQLPGDPYVVGVAYLGWACVCVCECVCVRERVISYSQRDAYIVGLADLSCVVYVCVCACACARVC